MRVVVQERLRHQPDVPEARAITSRLIEQSIVVRDRGAERKECATISPQLVLGRGRSGHRNPQVLEARDETVQEAAVAFLQLDLATKLDSTKWSEAEPAPVAERERVRLVTLADGERVRQLTVEVVGRHTLQRQIAGARLRDVRSFTGDRVPSEPSTRLIDRHLTERLP